MGQQSVRSLDAKNFEEGEFKESGENPV